MESSSNQKSVKEINILYLRFFKVTTLCLDDSFAHSWHSQKQLHLECFDNSLEGVPTYAEHLLKIVKIKKNPVMSLCPNFLLLLYE